MEQPILFASDLSLSRRGGNVSRTLVSLSFVSKLTRLFLFLPVWSDDEQAEIESAQNAFGWTFPCAPDSPLAKQGGVPFLPDEDGGSFLPRRFDASPRLLSLIFSRLHFPYRQILLLSSSSGLKKARQTTASIQSIRPLTELTSSDDRTLIL